MRPAAVVLFLAITAATLVCALGWGIAAGSRDTYRQLFHEAMELQEATHNDLRVATLELKSVSQARLSCMRLLQDVELRHNQVQGKR